MSRGLTLSVLRLQEAWGCGLMVIKELILLFGERFSHLQSNSGNMHEILLSRYFREELGEGLLQQEGPRGSCWLVSWGKYETGQKAAGLQVQILYVPCFLFVGKRFHSTSLTFLKFQRADSNNCCLFQLLTGFISNRLLQFQAKLSLLQGWKPVSDMKYPT